MSNIDFSIKKQIMNTLTMYAGYLFVVLWCSSYLQIIYLSFKELNERHYD